VQWWCQLYKFSGTTLSRPMSIYGAPSKAGVS